MTIHLKSSTEYMHAYFPLYIIIPAISASSLDFGIIPKYFSSLELSASDTAFEDDVKVHFIRVESCFLIRAVRLIYIYFYCKRKGMSDGNGRANFHFKRRNFIKKKNVSTIEYLIYIFTGN